MSGVIGPLVTGSDMARPQDRSSVPFICVERLASAYHELMLKGYGYAAVPSDCRSIILQKKKLVCPEQYVRGYNDDAIVYFIFPSLFIDKLKCIL